MAVEKFDANFEKIMDNIVTEIKNVTGDCSQKILSISSQFLERDEHQTLEDFHKLYFSKDGSIAKSKVAMNQDVDSIIAQASEGDVGDVVENEELKEQRLRLSTVQKDLEALITMEKGIREKLAPVLASMQFEDALSQRLEHICEGWKQIIRVMLSGDDQNDLDVCIAIIKSQLSSLEEEELFYKVVLEEEPPAELGKKEQNIFMF